MERFDRLSSVSSLGRLVAWLKSLNGSLQAGRPVVRRALAGSALAAAGLLIYLSLASTSAGRNSYLNSGRRFAPDDLAKISRALDRQRIPHRVDDERRVSVASAKREVAEEVVAKLDLGPRLPGELRDQASSSSPWESPRDKEAREHHDRAKIVETMINDLPGIVGSFVWVNRPKARLGLQPPGKPSALVWLETEGDRQLPFRTVQSITTILTGYEDGLLADAITVVDRRGHKYLVAGNPELSALSSDRAREEELTQEILEQLEGIRGVRVSVKLPAGEPKAPEPDASPAARSAAGPESTPDSPPETPPPAVALNRAMSLDPEPAAPATTAAPRPPVPSSPAAGPARAPATPGRVWVRVPRSYYYQVSLLPGHKEPAREDLIKLAARVEEQIRTGIDMVVPLSGPAAWKATVDIIQDEIPAEDSPAVPPSERRLPALDWRIAAALGAMAVALVGLGSWALHARRPSGRVESAPIRLRYEAGTSGPPGPSERVREFVRRNPEAAVSVLERWTGQGGPRS
jgi:hypothetical protein